MSFKVSFQPKPLWESVIAKRKKLELTCDMVPGRNNSGWSIYSLDEHWGFEVNTTRLLTLVPGEFCPLPLSGNVLNARPDTILELEESWRQECGEKQKGQIWKLVNRRQKGKVRTAL